MGNQGDQNSRLEAILNNAVDAIITIDDQGTIRSANPASERMFGYSQAELLGQNISLLMPSPYSDEHNRYLRDYANGVPAKIIGIGREVMGQRKDGYEFPMHLAVSEFDEDGRRMFTGIVRDISDSKRVEWELKRLNEDLEACVRERTAELRRTQAELVQKEKLATLGQLSGGIAHEIRNPLNAIKTSIYYLLHAQNPTAEKSSEHLERIDRQVAMIDNVVTALSDVAMLPIPNRRPLEMEGILREIVRAAELPSSIEVRWELPEPSLRALADELQLPIVFKNLVDNARDAMPDGGTLTIGIRAQLGNVCVSVKDTGHGIPEEQLSRILEPLCSTKTRGMGLGLAISRTIVEKNGGQLKIASQAGIGSTFAVFLALADTP